MRDNFWSKVDRGAPDACWEWQGSLATRGLPYGRFTVGSGRAKRTQLAHRLSWELCNGPIRGGACVLHRCDNPRCVNPGHLFLGTHADNMADMAAKGRGRTGFPSGSRRGGRLSDNDVREIRALVARGVERGEIAAKYSVNRSTVCRIAIGVRFAGVV